jgi:chromosome segregation ATPase
VIIGAFIARNGPRIRRKRNDSYPANKKGKTVELNKDECRITVSLIMKELSSLDGSVLQKQKEMKELNLNLDYAEQAEQDAKDSQEKISEEIEEAKTELEVFRTRQEKLEELRGELEVAIEADSRGRGRGYQKVRPSQQRATN